MHEAYQSETREQPGGEGGAESIEDEREEAGERREMHQREETDAIDGVEIGDQRFTDPIEQDEGI